MPLHQTIGIGERAFGLVPTATQVVNDEIAIDYDAGNYATRELTRFQPITDLFFMLTGGITVGTANATALKPYGALNLVKELAVLLNNDYYLMKLPGKVLGILSQWYDKHKGQAVDPGLTQASHPIKHGLHFPVDSGGFYSCLDAAAANSLMVQCLWGQASDVLTPDSTTTLAVDSGTKLKISSHALSGYPAGAPGGLNYGYARHMWQFNNHAIPSVGENRFVLNKARLYSGLAMFVTNDSGAPSDDVLSKVKLQIGTTVIKTHDLEKLRDKNMRKYNFTDSDLTGVYLLDWGAEEHLEQQQSITGGQDMEIVYDAGAAGDIVFVHDYYIAPTLKR